MLQTLRRIVQEVNSTRDLSQVLEIIVRRVKKAIEADVCSIYLFDNDEAKFTLMATDGLNEQLVGQVHMESSAGLVSLVAQRTDPLNLDDAQEHPRFELFTDLNEERFHSFTGIPITHHREVLGVLVAQSESRIRFSHDVVNFLVTIAAQLAGSIINAQATRQTLTLSKQTDSKQSTTFIRQDHRPLTGQPGSPGIAVGSAVSITSSFSLNAVPDRPAENIEDEMIVFRIALESVRQDIKSLSSQLLSDGLPTEDVAIFDAYLLMLDSNTLIDSTMEKIQAGNWAAGALRETISEHIKLFGEMDNPYLQERVKDIRDLGQCIFNQMHGINELPLKKLSKDTIIVAEDISATLLADIEKTNISGIVLKNGSRTSHVAILARAMGIPTVVGVNELPVMQLDGNQLVADGYNGKVYISPPDNIIKEYSRLISQEEELSQELRELSDKPATTIDEVTIPLYANSGLVADITPTKESGAEGIGLYRTEYPFMIRQRFPGEEEQSKIYREVMASLAPRPVVLRTLDIGGDKSLSYFPIEEDNPFLGWRGIRVTLDHPEIFMIQLRAMLIASVGLDNLNILFPMVSKVSEVEDAINLLERAYQELLAEGYNVEMPKVGVMVEVPSVVFQMRRIASMVDFISIGTNDLIQYLMAVDRNNANVADLYESLNPAVLTAIKQVIDQAHQENVPVSVCGEMAGDPLAAILLLGMSIDSLSTSVASLPRIKWMIRNYSFHEAKGLVDKALTMKNAYVIKSMLTSSMEKKGLGGLIRAGR
ncbi:MAG: phosphoenolpyruvate--protein phosphotransferase [gamma proteobacterium symbiont of Bathyaustriella thionipta]|nr:phosphoenolpyruvate--protein phosphotransferase [gamma proteobacterium symbiont of Bathyaustriella thionipta]MCU7949892.1 phosphoenolpyruvate--protein phosphotransferase [gamma proteobacterium symbiont of Bathyaustriella thionipta]MCU7953905.1 phosphoenolpyruvate--protein phosphotransferase [gamma proteobacterium symbiont of Bathyaustriella thionipta]MCU7956489.1 phosphoenolpyruvate--protein phosphotransferase [gamma proteobacterium symbiont of Bathyaustriella thionipta]MCU7965711.1 phosphoe